MGILAYRFPNRTTQLLKGDWKSSLVEELPEECFFITDFQKSKAFFFNKENEINSFTEKDLSFNEDSTVFEAEGKYYLSGLQFFIDGFDSNEIQKAIYSRIKIVDKLETDDFYKIFQALSEKYGEQALIYLVSDDQFGTWIGATPEVLLSGNETELHSMALAGTKNKKSDKWTNKEMEEHQYVVDFIKEKIKAHSPSQLKIGDRNTVKKGAVYHLQTDFDFIVSPENWNQLLNDLHPTPAVCGTPQDKALDYILQLEPHQREFYTGMIGYRSNSEIDVFVNLRCMQILQNKYALYIGGGITKESDIVKEFQETENKSETLLSVIESI